LKRVSINGFVYILNPEDKAWLHEDEVIEGLMIPELTRRGNQYKFPYELAL